MNRKNWPLQNLPGIDPMEQKQLNDLGILTTFDLLRQGWTPDQRRQLSENLTIHLQHVNKWVALANLASIPSVGLQHCGLLLHAGISTPQQLAGASIQRLHRQVQRLQIKLLYRNDQCPGPDQVSQWIQQAKLLTQPGT